MKHMTKADKIAYFYILLLKEKKQMDFSVELKTAKKRKFRMDE